MTKPTSANPTLLHFPPFPFISPIVLSPFCVIASRNHLPTFSYSARQPTTCNAELCYRLSVGPSARPFVTRVDQSKTVEVRIVQFSP